MHTRQVDSLSDRDRVEVRGGGTAAAAAEIEAAGGCYDTDFYPFGTIVLVGDAKKKLTSSK